MKGKTTSAIKRERWAEFRFSVIGGLLAAPPSDHGSLGSHFKKLAAQKWIHPIDGKPFEISWHAIERWYYRARRSGDSPVRSLARTAVTGPWHRSQDQSEAGREDRRTLPAVSSLDLSFTFRQPERALP